MFIVKVAIFVLAVFSVVLTMACCKIGHKARDLQDPAACIAKHRGVF